MKVVLSEKEKKTFLDQMIELKRNGCRNPFVKISDSINSIRKQGDPYNSRQLCHFWRNYLDPDVCQENLDDKEKKYIDDWISLHKSEDGGIVWKKLRQDLKNQFGPFRSENKLKNYWYSKQRSKKGTNNDIVIPSLPETIDISIPTTPTTHSYLFSQYQPQNREPLPNISYIFNYHHNDSLDLPPLLHYQQNLSALPTLYPSLIQEPKLPELPPNI
ncbi:unnamed protein product [Rhizophagus irregularis]|uniref:HTH myb-type domain-containing protein n=1 Tax=Rhizophagus irregularis TaxID=588596 RepID=A0A916EHS8_9GLOM|nr:unnamed protein product [Rhizophagus irregularis]